MDVYNNLNRVSFFSPFCYDTLMKLSKYICANMLFLIGNAGLCIFLLSLIGTYNIQGNAWMYIERNCDIWAFTILGFLLISPIEILLHKITHNKFILNIPFKNENIRYTYSILFWVGIICSVLYLLLYVWIITR